MIVDKKTTQQPTIQSVTSSTDNQQSTVGQWEEVSENALEQMYFAVRRVLSSIKVDPNDPNSESYFKCIMVDNGQFDRIVLSKRNEEFAIPFPAVFIRYTDVNYLVQQQRVGEGRAYMRIRYVLNRLNNSDDGYETEGFRVFEMINKALQDAKDKEEALTERFNLKYFDMPQTQGDGLQAFWIDYEIWFREMSAWQYRNYVERYLVFPPYVDHSDAPAKDAAQNTPKHNSHVEVDYESASGYDVSAFDPLSPEQNTNSSVVKVSQLKNE